MPDLKEVWCFIFNLRQVYLNKKIKNKIAKCASIRHLFATNAM